MFNNMTQLLQYIHIHTWTISEYGRSIRVTLSSTFGCGIPDTLGIPGTVMFASSEWVKERLNRSCLLGPLKLTTKEGGSVHGRMTPSTVTPTKLKIDAWHVTPVQLKFCVQVTPGCCCALNVIAWTERHMHSSGLSGTYTGGMRRSEEEELTCTTE